jgi:hypothetical protein
MHVREIRGEIQDQIHLVEDKDQVEGLFIYFLRREFLE